MKNGNRLVLTLCALLAAPLALVACGGAAEPEGEGTSGGEHHCEHEGECECDHCEHGCEHGDHHGEHGDHHGEHGDHHGGMPAELTALHDELAPVYHLEPGAERATAACEHAAGFQSHAGTVAAMTPPDGGDAEMWTASAAQLSSTTDALAAGCASGGGNAEAELESVHTAFHALMESSGGHH